MTNTTHNGIAHIIITYTSSHGFYGRFSIARGSTRFPRFRGTVNRSMNFFYICYSVVFYIFFSICHSIINNPRSSSALAKFFLKGLLRINAKTLSRQRYQKCAICPRRYNLIHNSTIFHYKIITTKILLQHIIPRTEDV